jgi:hypothetical protein
MVIKNDYTTVRLRIVFLIEVLTSLSSGYKL